MVNNNNSGVDLKTIRLIGYDKDKHAYDITRSIRPDTEQLLNMDIDNITVTERDRTKRLQI